MEIFYWLHENFANNFFKTETNNNVIIVLKCVCKRATEKNKRVRVVKSKPEALRHFKVDPVLNINFLFTDQSYLHTLFTFQQKKIC